MSAIYVSCDMEGTAGVSSWKQCDPGDTHEYPVYRRYMTQEVVAAIEGARRGGATEVLINDSHWSMRNLVWDLLPVDDAVRVVSGTPKPLSMGQGIDEHFAAAFFTGYHARAGEGATLSHTSSPETIYRVSVNGTECSEALLFAALAGSYGVPVTLVTGDRTIVDEAARHLPWAVGVAVKEPIGYSAVDTLTPHAARLAVAGGAFEAMRRIPNARLFTFAPPCELVIETVNVENAEFMELLPEFRRIGGRAVAYTGLDYRSTLRAYLVALRLGAGANAVA